jgi:hypothetical protein
MPMQAFFRSDCMPVWLRANKGVVEQSPKTQDFMPNFDLLANPAHARPAFLEKFE